MRWQGERQSENVIDERESTGSSARRPRAGLGVVLVVGVALLALGGDPKMILSLLSQQIQQGSGGPLPSSGPVSSLDNEDSKAIVGATLASLEETWTALFKEKGLSYNATPVLLFRGVTETACGYGQTASGPFYCPPDSKVYLDFGFLDELNALGGRGDFALAYVVAHEVAHHVQNLLTPRAMQERQSNQQSVKIELQADRLAGVWVHHAKRNSRLLEEGDIEEGLNAAASVGDDRIQKATSGVVVPESFTHGSSKQRVEAFTIGYSRGSLESCGLT